MTVTAQTPLADVKSATKRPWLFVAAEASKVIRDGVWTTTHPSASDWTTDAAQRAGYSANAFRRQIRLADFLRVEVPPEQWHALLDHGAPFGAIELLQRLSDVDRHEARSLLPDAIAGKLLYRDVLAKYEAARATAGGGSGKQVYANRVQQFRQRARSAIAANLKLFVGARVGQAPMVLRTGLPGFVYARPDFVAVERAVSPAGGVTSMDAFEVRLFGQDDSKQVLLRTIERLALMQMFFRQTWLIYPANQPPVQGHVSYIEALCRHLDELQFTSVGVALISEKVGKDTPQIRHRAALDGSPGKAVLLRHATLRAVRS